MFDNELVNEITKGVSDRISSKKVAFQFILEELDAARQGNEVAIQFAENSGFCVIEYEDAMQNSFEEVDGLQQFLLSSLMPYSSNIDYMVNLRLRVVNKIIDDWELKLKSHERTSKLLEKLKTILEDDESVMPSLTSIIPTPKSAKEKHIYFSEKNIALSKKIISILTEVTGDGLETIINRSLKNCVQYSLDNDDTWSEDELHLVDVVSKIENSIYGDFVNINNDLGFYIEENEDCSNLMKMSYGYARRFAVAGMCLQGVVSKDHYDHVLMVFKSFQLSTVQTKEFQISAVKQAYELIKSYTTLFDEQGLSVMVKMVERGFDDSDIGEGVHDINVVAFIVNKTKLKFLNLGD